MRIALRVFRSTIFLVVLTAAANLAAQVPPPPPPPVPMGSGTGIGSGTGTRPARKPGATVRGRLVYEDTGAPIRFAEIGLSRIDSTGDYGETVKTNAEGEFVLTDVASGEYYPIVKNRGVLNPEVFYTSSVSIENRKAALEISFQKLVVQGLGDYQYFVRAGRGASISGAVRYFDGEPVVGVDVDAMIIIDGKPEKVGLGGPHSVGSEKTDEQGFYRFSGLPEGNYYIRVDEGVPHSKTPTSYNGGTNFDPTIRNVLGEGLLQTWYPESPIASQATAVDAFYGSATEGINITLPERKLYDVSGRVVRRKTREPLKNFRVTVTPLLERFEGDTTAVSLSRIVASARSGYIGSGENEIPSEWSIINLPKGRYLLTAAPLKVYGGPDTSNAGKANWQKYPTVLKEIELTDGNMENVLIEIPEAGSISAVVLTKDADPVPQNVMFVAVNQENRQIEKMIPIPRTGESKPSDPISIRFAGLAAGRYKLEIMGREFYVKSVSVGNDSVEGNTVEVKEGEDIRNVRVLLANDFATVRGKVANYQPGQSVLVILIGEGHDTAIAGFTGPASSGVVYPDGSFEFKTRPGTYEAVVLLFEEKAPEVEMIYRINELRKNARVLTVLPREVLNLELPMPQ